MQTLFPKSFPEGITFTRTFATSGGVHLGELPGGGFARINGDPIQDEAELREALPRSVLPKALEWFAHRDEATDEDEPPAVTWRKGRLVYVESGAELTSHAEIIQAFPDESPMQRAALEWFGQQQAARHTARQQVSQTNDRLIPSKAEVDTGKKGASGLPRKDVSAV